MDVSQMLNYHKKEDADLSISAIQVPIEEASDFGIMEVDENWRLIGFEEKPKNPKTVPGNPKMCLASMGNYIFNKNVLGFIQPQAEAIPGNTDCNGITQRRNLVNPDGFPGHAAHFHQLQEYIVVLKRFYFNCLAYGYF